MKTLVLGGVRSGKSQLAEDMAEDMAIVASLGVVAAALYVVFLIKCPNCDAALGTNGLNFTNAIGSSSKLNKCSK